jgi:hypothetical protein
VIKTLAFVVPATASTTTLDASGVLSGLDAVDSLLIVMSMVGVTGGTLNLYLQVSDSVDSAGSPVWVDYLAPAQLADGAAAVVKAYSVSRFAQQTTAITVGVGDVPALAAGSIVGGDFGERMRLVAVTGVGVSIGCTITIRLIGSRVARRTWGRTV